MHNYDDKYLNRPGFEHGTSRLQAPVDSNYPSASQFNDSLLIFNASLLSFSAHLSPSKVELDITFTCIVCLVPELLYLMFSKMVMTAILNLD